MTKDATTTALDARHLLCPLPLLRLQQTINRLPSQSHVMIYCTDPGVKADIPAWCRINGHECLKIEESNNEVIIHVKKN